MRVCFLPADVDGAGHYRCLFPARELRERGHDAALAPNQGVLDKASDFLFLRYDAEQAARVEADVTVLHRPGSADAPAVVRLLQARGSAVVVDTDDLVAPHVHNPGGQDVGALRRALATAELVTVSTPFLAEQLERLNRNVLVLPNYLDWQMWADVEPVYEQECRRFRIGWMGLAPKRGSDLALLAGLVGPWLRRHPDVEFVAAGDARVHDLLQVPHAQRVTTASMSFRHYELAAITATMDVGLVPLADNNFNRAKSALKGMEYAACGIPCIASPTESYREWVDEGETGFLARRPRDWQKALDSFLAEPDLSRRLGARAREKALAHTIQEHVGEWEESYAALGSRADADPARAHAAFERVPG